MATTQVTTTTNGVHSETNGETRTQMTKFWKQHSQNGDVTEMMLDTQAAEISDIEIDEIIKYLPDYEGKDVLELGAGIGRFTSILSKKVKSVVAVDFMDNFVKKNQEVNGHNKNVTFLCKNVLELEFEENSLDLIFSNWLLMYLGDNDIRILIDKMLKWLKPTGRLFFRESCYQQSGNKERSFNPTIYRSPNEYTNLVSSVTNKSKNGKAYGFDLVTSKSVETYIMMKNNHNQICWLMEPAERDSAEYHGYETFQIFLDQKQYSLNGILRYEEIFGRDYISTGGHSTTQEFCGSLGLTKGQKVLDVGCGIGGSAFHMGREFGAEVIGIDLSSNMIGIAIERQREYQIPKVYFEVADATKIQYPEDAFDVIYSRDTILHIKHKDQLFANFYKWLKPGGKVLITDYVCGPHDKHSQEFKDYVAQRGYFLLTVDQYGQELQNAGFTNVKAVDKTDMFVSILQKELQLFDRKKGDFAKKFSVEDFDSIKTGWNDKLRRCGKGDQKWGFFYAEKA
ncbi:uncharacterized protein LOC120334118 [Styela clava]